MAKSKNPKKQDVTSRAQRKEKITIVLPDHHEWLKGLRGVSLIIEHLLDKEFGTDTGSTRAPRQAEKLKVEKLMKGLAIIDQMKAQKDNTEGH